MSTKSLTRDLPRDCIRTMANELTLLQLQVFKRIDKLCNAVVKQLLETKSNQKLQEVKVFLKSSISLLDEGTKERADLQDVLDDIDTSAACHALFRQDTSSKAEKLLYFPLTDLCQKSPDVFDEIVDKTPASSFKEELLGSLKLGWIQWMNGRSFFLFEGSFISYILIPPQLPCDALPTSYFRISEKYMDIRFYESAETSATDFEVLTHQQSMISKLDWYEYFISRLCEDGRGARAIIIIEFILKIDPEGDNQQFSASKLRLVEILYDVLYDSGHVEEAFKFLDSTRSQPFFSEKYDAALRDFRLARANARIKPNPESSAKLSEACQSFLSVSKEESDVLRTCIEVLIHYGFEKEAIPALHEMKDLVIKYFTFEDFGFEEELPAVVDSMDQREKARLDKILEDREYRRNMALSDKVQEVLLSSQVKEALEAKKSGDEERFNSLYNELGNNDQLTVDAQLEEMEYHKLKDIPKIKKPPNLEKIKLARAEFARCIEEKLIPEALEWAKKIPDDPYKFFALLSAEIPELSEEALRSGRRMVKELGLTF